MKSARSKFVLMMVLAALVGVLVGLLITFFHMGVDWVEAHRADIVFTLWPWPEQAWIGYMLVSTVMIVISVYLVRHYAPEAGGSGIQEIEGVVGNKRRMHPLQVIVVKFVGGILSLGAGMVMGREGPSVQIGGALGQIVSQRFPLSRGDINLLIAAGAGAGLATTFNAPLAGVLFVFEEMREEVRYTYTAIQSVLTATVASIVTLRVFFGNEPAIPMAPLPMPPAADMWIFVVFGVCFGILGYLFNKYLIRFTQAISHLKGCHYCFVIVPIGLVIGFLYYYYPESVGEGYNAIHIAFDKGLPMGMLLMLFVLRFFLTMFSYGSGAPGGIFAPMLALGTLFGVAFGLGVDAWVPSLAIDPKVFALVGMSALFAATVRAPLTGIVLVAELTLNFSLILPMLTTALFATMTANALGGRAIYTLLLEQTLKVAKFGRHLYSSR